MCLPLLAVGVSSVRVKGRLKAKAVHHRAQSCVGAAHEGVSGLHLCAHTCTSPGLQAVLWVVQRGRVCAASGRVLCAAGSVGGCVHGFPCVCPAAKRGHMPGFSRLMESTRCWVATACMFWSSLGQSIEQSCLSGMYCGGCEEAQPGPSGCC